MTLERLQKVNCKQNVYCITRTDCHRGQETTIRTCYLRSYSWHIPKLMKFEDRNIIKYFIPSPLLSGHSHQVKLIDTSSR